MIRVDCPACGKSLKVADDLAGKTGKCPACSERLKIPEPKPVISQSIAAPAPPTRPPVVRAQPRRDPLPAPVQVTPTVVAVQVNQPSKASHSLGIASLILGIIAFLICWVPFLGLLGLPLSLLGILLGGTGFLIALFRKGSGIGFPIAGTSLSLLSAIAVITITGAAASAVNQVGKAIEESSAKANATQQTIVAAAALDQPNGAMASPVPQNVPEPAAEKTAPGEEWGDAQNTIQQGDLQLRVTKVSIGQVPLKDSFNDDSKSQDELLMVNLELTNINATKKMDYSAWSGKDISFSRDYATLVDNFGNSYKRINFGFSTNPVGAVERSESIYPNKTVNDVLVFEMPIDTIEYLRLELPAKNFGGTGMLRLEIPKQMISR